MEAAWDVWGMKRGTALNIGIWHVLFGLFGGIMDEGTGRLVGGSLGWAGIDTTVKDVFIVALGYE